MFFGIIAKFAMFVRLLTIVVLFSSYGVFYVKQVYFGINIFFIAFGRNLFLLNILVRLTIIIFLAFRYLDCVNLSGAKNCDSAFCFLT